MAAPINIPIVVTGEEQLTGLENKFRKAGKAGDNAFDGVGASAGRLRQQTTGLTASVGALRNQLLVFGFATAGAIAVTKKLVNEASSLEESVNAVNVVFGEGAKQILSFGKNAATSVGLANSGFNKLSTETGALLRDVGLSEKEVARQTIELTKRASDLASVFDKDVTIAMSALNQAIRGETEAIRVFGGDVLDRTLEQFLFAKGINKTAESMTQQEKKLLRLQVVMSQTEVTADDFLNTSESLANQQRILSSNIDNIAASLGSFLIPALASATSIVNDLIGGWIDLEEAMKSNARTDEQFLSRQAQALAAQEELLTLKIATSKEDQDILAALSAGGEVQLNNLTSVQTALAETLKLMTFVREEEEKTLAVRQLAIDVVIGDEHILKNREDIRQTDEAINVLLGEDRDIKKEIRDTDREILEIERAIGKNIEPTVNAIKGISDSQRFNIALTTQFANATLDAAAGWNSIEDSIKSIGVGLLKKLINAGISSAITGNPFGETFLKGFAGGGSFRVGGSGGTDSQFVGFKASPDETVTITKPGQTINNEAKVNINAEFPNVTTFENAFAIKTQLAPMLDEMLRNGEIRIGNA